eukprot:gnl/TRDRNA2_/TRDRNA2_162431_c0_seq1.p2 gnl/TRDRNA2_/TRDRNA2_162431_c0~~gnl/TRDRNA2_/TRDRNA2_162431_c0_seq1.p2  ORF type:complete len:114 (-),score=18.28 gnl/TRDRNA2_/TRDRNA2_162431_c0_seq1:174-515(-)
MEEAGTEVSLERDLGVACVVPGIADKLIISGLEEAWMPSGPSGMGNTSGTTEGRPGGTRLPDPDLEDAGMPKEEARLVPDGLGDVCGISGGRSGEALRPEVGLDDAGMPDGEV